MSSLTPEQARFVLQSIGKTDIYQTTEGKPPDVFIESFSNETDNPVGRLASRLVIEYQLGYTSEGKITLRNPPTVFDLRKEVGRVGMRIPKAYRDNPEHAMEYLEKFGYTYKIFDKATGDSYKRKWLDVPGENSLVVDPNLIKNDNYLNPFFRAWLCNCYTDFDIFSQFPFIKERADKFKNRKQLIDAVYSAYHPAGTFLFSFEDSSIRLKHEFGDFIETYPSASSIRSISKDGILTFGGLALDRISLYQLAFLLHPSYVEKIHDVKLLDDMKEVIKDLYLYFLDQIKKSETKNDRKVRFSDRFIEFNRDLDE